MRYHNQNHLLEVKIVEPDEAEEKKDINIDLLLDDKLQKRLEK